MKLEAIWKQKFKKNYTHHMLFSIGTRLYIIIPGDIIVPKNYKLCITCFKLYCHNLTFAFYLSDYYSLPWKSAMIKTQ